ncbi:MAG: ATP synthase F1 subunit gamma [Oscillospiraceae bacterium]|nr:ATP synthase F1 subunit gamma [Oscillospiraceae bacterium]
MASTGELKARMESIAETKKVTDAMYMISSVKMRKAKREVENTEPYFKALKEQISDLLTYIPETKNRYFHVPMPEGKEHSNHGILLVTSDKGLAGAYNHTAIKVAEDYMSRHPETELFIIGEYGRQHFSSRKIPFHEEFEYSAAFPSVWEAEAICADLLDYFDDGRMDEINIIYTKYMGAKPSKCQRNVLLPLDKSRFYKEEKHIDNPFKEFYPDADTLLDGIVPSYLTGFIYSSLVDSYCSEQQARMLAMSTAGKNADEMVKKLKTEYNALRQASITREMIEITSGAKALGAKRMKNEEGRSLE